MEPPVQDDQVGAVSTSMMVDADGNESERQQETQHSDVVCKDRSFSTCEALGACGLEGMGDELVANAAALETGAHAHRK